MHDRRYLVSAQGVRMPRIIYGTAWKASRTADLVETALRLGFRGIDTACQPKHYSEPGVGAGIATVLGSALARGDLYLQSKFTALDGHDPNQVPYDRAAPLATQVAQSCAVSLKNLGTDYLDGLVLHSPLANARETVAAWRALETLVDQGSVRQLGLSNCYASAEFDTLYRAARIKPAVLQNRFYARTGYDRELRAYCRTHGIVYQSFWTLTANPDILTHDSVRRLAIGHRRTAAQILLRYLVQIELVPLTGTTSSEHMRDDLALFEFELDARECAAMARLF